MKFSLLIYYFLIKTILLIENNNTLNDGLYEIFSKIVKEMNLLDVNLTQNCLFNKSYYPDLNQNYLNYKKLLLDSSKSLNDISTFDECMNNNYGFENNISNFSYILIYIDNRNNSKLNLSYEATYLFAMCMVDDGTCTQDDDYINFFLLFFNNYYDNPTSKDKISIFYLNKTSKIFKYIFLSLNQIPWYIIIIYILFFLFKEMFFKLFKICFCCCSTKDEEKKNDIKIKKKEKKVNWQKIIINTFSFSKNFEMLLSKEIEDNIYNDDGIIYIKGIRGISMLLYLFGVLYFNLYNSPMTQKTKKSFTDNLKNPISFIFYFGMKYSPRLLLSCSGFNLFYKFICYFDEEYDENKHNKGKDKPNLNFSNFIYFKNLFSFILHQLYKYVYFILITTFFIFSFFTLNVFLSEENPMWGIFYYLFLYKIKPLNFILFFLGIRPVIFSHEVKIDKILNYFWLIQCEMFFFLITSITLYFIYKYQINLNRIIIIIFITIEIIKVLLFYFSKIIYDIVLYPSFIYSNINYGLIIKSSILNYPYFLIGVFFSALNYSIQKLLNYDKCYRQHKLFLSSSVKLMKKIKEFRTKNHYLFSFLCIIVILLFGFSQSIFFFIIIDILDIKKTITLFFDNLLFKTLMLYDTELVIISIHLLSLIFSISEEKYIINFLTHKLWIFFDKIYFSYILLINPFILYILYRGETKIEFTILNSLFYSLSCLFTFIIIVIICYVLFELPLRRITKYIFKIKKNERKYKILNIIEKKYNNNLQISFNDNILYNEENKNEEEKEEEEEEDKIYNENNIFLNQ